MPKEIHWNQAEQKVSEIRNKKQQRFDELKEQIETMDFDCIDGPDLDFFASELTDNDLTKKKWSTIDIVNLNMSKNPQKSKYDYIHCFEGSDSDDIMYFF